jgi:hypothetical protein
MNQHQLRAILIALWREFGALTRDDPLFQTKRMVLHGKIIFYTKILAVIHRGKQFYSPLPNTRTQTEVFR